MASRSTAERWLRQLTHLPTASGLEHEVVTWVSRWAARRDDLRLTRDSGGNVLVGQKGRKKKAPVVAVAHMDHPAFVITEVVGREATFEFRGGVTAPYFEDARVEVVSRPDGASGRVTEYREQTQKGTIRFTPSGEVREQDIAMWKFRATRARKAILQAPACDDLAGVAAALSALDRMRGNPDLRHYSVLLTRAEEVGLVGAIHSAKHRTIPVDARVISIETSREMSYAPMGAGPVIRTGDRSTVFDRDMTNLISRVSQGTGLVHQRKLMDGGGCEATAFGAFGYQAAGLCVPLGNWHNRGNLDLVEAGEGPATPMLEEISLDDFHGLVELILLAVTAVDLDDPLISRLDESYETMRNLLA